MAEISNNWSAFITAITPRGGLTTLQYLESTGQYYVYVDIGQDRFSAFIWLGAVPDTIIAQGYSQAQNDADKSDFETNYKPSANAPLVQRTSDGKAGIATEHAGSYQPDPASMTIGSAAFVSDASGRLETHSAVTSDEGSFRDDFSGSAITTALTGTLGFTNSSIAVTGVGTLFTSEVKFGQWIKKSSDGETLYAQVDSVDSDTEITLSGVYGGTTAAGVAAVVSNWATVTAATGGSITLASSIISLVSGTANAQQTNIRRLGDYLPYTFRVTAAISQRIANQTSSIGFMDSFTSPTKQAVVQFTGTDNTNVQLVTASGAAASDIQTTQVTLPNAGVTSGYHTYKIDISGTQVNLSIDGVIVAAHMLHVPGPYDAVNIFAGTSNTAAVASTTLTLDALYFYNIDRLQIDNDFSGEPSPASLTDGVSTVAIKAASTAPVAADPALVVSISPNSRHARSTTGTATNVASSATNVTLLASNTNRLGATIYNDGTQNLFAKLGATASLTSFTVRITSQGYYEVPFGYTGLIDGIWSSANGSARIVELT